VIVEKTHRGSELALFRSKLEKDVGGGPRGGGRAVQTVGVFKTRNEPLGVCNPWIGMVRHTGTDHPRGPTLAAVT
jgi:hypothetical protein